MFLRYYVVLEAPAEEVAGALTRDPAEWVPGLVERADRHREELLAEVGVALGGHRLMAKVVHVDLGEPRRGGESVALPIAWSATGARGLFPVMDGEIGVAPLGTAGTLLSLDARYAPPFGALGAVADRALLHRVAETTIKDFLDGVADAIRAAIGTGPSPPAAGSSFAHR
jgi:hypothetical protein